MLILSGCKSSTEPEVEEIESIFPMYIDENSNDINDFVEQTTHDDGFGKASSTTTTNSSDPGHSFVDENNDGICDYAQDGSPTWHGPGFIDENNNGICDYWDESLPMHQRHEGMRFHDENDNHVNDYMEEETHWGEHDFVDENQDGICDLAQNGSPTWHGPGFVDMNGNGMNDHWEEGGRGHGGMMGGGHN
ncbi:hypothetical protein [Rhodohalobacter sp. 614A]|uniref:hypothetical protein n=1 Tax=Rhodohalobacter sp. 614A TaxID=2908649 RepID=UPI001F42D463|nr:hypothetical protein [Rhodohalobacter sp. 614A]